VTVTKSPVVDVTGALVRVDSALVSAQTHSDAFTNWRVDVNVLEDLTGPTWLGKVGRDHLFQISSRIALSAV
jgi:hypothetical protein